MSLVKLTQLSDDRTVYLNPNIVEDVHRVKGVTTITMFQEMRIGLFRTTIKNAVLEVVEDVDYVVQELNRTI